MGDIFDTLFKYGYKIFKVDGSDTVTANDLKTIKYWSKGQHYKSIGYSLNGTYVEGIGETPEQCLESLWSWIQHFNSETIISEIETEVERQISLWGMRNHPSVDVALSNRYENKENVDANGTIHDINGIMLVGEQICKEYEIPSEARARLKCNNAFKKNEGTWTHIAVEELSEAVGAVNDAHRREELVQLAAVIVNWIHCIDRNS